MTKNENCNSNCLVRRGFLKATAIGTATMMLGEVFPGRVIGQDGKQSVQVTKFERQTIAKLSELKTDFPIQFDFPGDGLHSNCALVKLGRNAGGGAGDQQDIVAFSGRCTHMGGDMSDGYVAEHKLLGCGEHLTTFDLTRHGIMVAGHATQALPQITLEIEGDEIIATGIVGLIYGYSTNPK